VGQQIHSIFLGYSISEIVDFVINEGNGLYFEKEREQITRFVELHQQYKTLMVILDEQEKIIAVARWNIVNKSVAFVLDVVVAKQYRKPLILRQMVAEGVRRFPTITQIMFERVGKYADREAKVYSVDRLLRR
jgi:hypothetical protein